jgi:hypothetical protein
MKNEASGLASSLPSGRRCRAVDLIGWHFWGGRGEVLKPNDGPVVTVTDFGPSFPLDPPPLRVATSGILDAFAHDDGPHGTKDGVLSMRFKTHESASTLFR